MWTRKIVRVIKPEDIGTVVVRDFGKITEGDVGKLVFMEEALDRFIVKRLVTTMENSDQRDLRLERIKGKEINLEKLGPLLAAVQKSRELHKRLVEKIDELEQSIMYHTAAVPSGGGCSP